MDRLMEYEVEMETAKEFYEPHYNTPKIVFSRNRHGKCPEAVRCPYLH